MARQCTQPKRPRNAAWFKEKEMLVEAQKSGQILDEEQLAFIVDPGIPNGDDPIAFLNKGMAFMTAVAASRFPTTKNQVRTSYNPRNQATIQDVRVIVQQVQGRKGQSYIGTGYKGEGHMARQCTQPKRPRNAVWFKEKTMLVEAQKFGQILDEEQLAFITKDLDAYDSDCDDVSNAKAIMMANLSNYDSHVISKLISSQHAIIHVIDNEETLILEEVSQSKMLAKLNDPISKEKKINATLINFVELNQLSKDFGKRFVPQQELSSE
nr:hypothetical protein [Tanacetum cinerariifolium]